MSIGDKGPRLGRTQGKSPEELRDQIEALRSELQNLTTLKRRSNDERSQPSGCAAR